MKKLTVESILLAEKKWQQLLEKEVELLFAKTWLPSHDLSHHKRVWNFTKQLLVAFEKQEHEFIEAAIIAAYMHDTGLTATLNPEHGEISSRFTRKFLEKTPLQNPLYQEELLEAITRHDDKSYSKHIFGYNSPGLYEILTIADDMDALGALGLYRYFEIYSMRGIPVDSMVDAIEKNIIHRFEFLSLHLRNTKPLLAKNKLRFEKAIRILHLLNSNEIQILKTHIESKNPIANILIEETGDISSLQKFIKEIKNEENEFGKNPYI
jgi:HD superfamily phosphodiesterase